MLQSNRDPQVQIVGPEGGPPHRTLFRIALFVVGLLGSYLTFVHFTHQSVACPETGLIDCTAVLTGPGSAVLGVPLAAGGVIWAASGWKSLHGAPWIRVTWRLLGIVGLGWAWLHEWMDGYVCLWCTAVQLAILVALGASLAWRDVGVRMQQGLHSLGASAPWVALGAGIVSAGSFVGYQVWLGTDTWGVVLSIAVLWGLASAWMTALIVSRTGRRWLTTLGAVGGTVPTTLLSGLGATSCASGVCATGISTAATVSSLGISGVLSGLFGAFAPLALQGLCAGWVLIVAGLWTYRRGGGAPFPRERNM